MVGIQTTLSTALVTAIGGYVAWLRSPTAAEDSERFSCRPFLPKLFEQTPPTASDPAIAGGLKKFESFLSSRFAEADIDALSVAVVTSEGALVEHNFGVNRGNESDTSPPTTSHSSYRMASVSKLFNVLEGLILEQRGVLSWSDPVEKYLPAFKYRLDGFVPGAHVPTHDQARISLFQLAAHVSGLGRDWPPGTVSGWPFDLAGGGPPPTNGLPFPSHEDLFRAIANTKLVSTPWAYPAYSNTATGLLGMALVAANRMASAHPENEPETYAQLVQRDIFGPLGLNGSHFLTTDSNKDMIVAPSTSPDVADQDFLDAMNPAGGQFSSLADCIKVVQFLLNPDHPTSLITRMSRDKWLQPVHDFEEDDWTQIGFIWEIIKARDSNNRLRKIYWKLGEMAGYHTAVAIHPGSSYGVVVLMGGSYPDAAKIAYDAFEILQPAFDTALATLSTELYSGAWKSADGQSAASIAVSKGTLYISELRLNGSDALEVLHLSGPVPLRSSERRDEFRLDTGLSFYNGKKHMGCYVYWNGQDVWGMRNGAAINLLYFTGTGKERKLHVPSVEVTMKRV